MYCIKRTLYMGKLNKEIKEKFVLGAKLVYNVIIKVVVVGVITIGSHDQLGFVNQAQLITIYTR